MVVSPFCFFGQASGHDFQFHVASWMDVARQWRAGVVFPRWAVWANYGYGEPRFIFYPPLSWCLGAGLGLFLPWKVVPATFIFLCLVLAGVSMFRLARAWLSPAGTIAATVLYVASPYQLVLAYYRSDFAELLAAALFPLAIHYAIRCGGHDGAGYKGEKIAGGVREPLRNVVLLAIAYGAIWLANAPAAVVASYALAFLLVLCSILRRSFRPLFTGLAALALGLMLAGVYIVPAAYEQAWVNIDQAVSAGYRPAENFLFTWILDPEHNLVNLEISAVAVLMITLDRCRRRRFAPPLEECPVHLDRDVRSGGDLHTTDVPGERRRLAICPEAALCTISVEMAVAARRQSGVLSWRVGRDFTRAGLRLS